ncbi:hypothetical protein ACJX0J_029082 [Zea mays]
MHVNHNLVTNHMFCIVKRAVPLHLGTRIHYLHLCFLRKVNLIILKEVNANITFIDYAANSVTLIMVRYQIKIKLINIHITRMQIPMDSKRIKKEMCPWAISIAGRLDPFILEELEFTQ